MASKFAEDRGNTETDDGTAAIQKKRARRVSFAEITSVHVFDRDEDYETPPEAKPSSDGPESGQPDQGLGFHRESTDGEDSRDSLKDEEAEDDDDELTVRKSFFQPFESPSPGSTIGSATSNDEDIFFGPVSASFIRTGRMSDSVASDENHDITMDSTAFSMHFRSLARSDSEDLKTPAGVHLSFDEKTPTQNTIPTNLGSSMVLTVAKNPISASSTSVEKLSGCSDSNDMSLVGENPDRYDYGRLSFGLDALLAEGTKDLHAVPISDKGIVSNSPINMKSSFLPEKKHNDLTEPNNSRDSNMKPVETCDMPGEAVSSVREKKQSDTNARCSVLADMHNASPCDVYTDGNEQSRSPNQLNKRMMSSMSKESNNLEMRPASDYAVNYGASSELENNVCRQLDVFASQECESPLEGSMSSSLLAIERQIVLDSGSLFKNLQTATPQKHSGSFVWDDIRKYGNGLSSIQRSIPRLEMLKTSPFSSTLKMNIDSTFLSSGNISKTSPYGSVLKRKKEDAQIKHMDTSAVCCEEKLHSVIQEDGERKHMTNMDNNDVEILESIVDASHPESSTGVTSVQISPIRMSTGTILGEEPVKLAEEGASLSQLTSLGKMRRMNLLTSADRTGGMAVTSGTDSLLSRSAFDHVKDKRATGSPTKSLHSLEKTMPKKLFETTGYRDSHSQDFWLYDQDNNTKTINLAHDADSREDFRNSSQLATVANKLDSPFMDVVPSSSPIIDTNHTKESTETADGRNINLHSLLDKSGATGIFWTPLADRDLKLKSMDENLLIGTDPVRSTKNLTEGWLRASSFHSASPVVHRGDRESSHQKLVEMHTQSPSRKGLYDVRPKDILNSVSMQDVQVANTSQLRSEFENLSSRKRGRKDVVPGNSNLLDEIERTDRSPKLHKSEGRDSEFLSVCPDKSNDGISRMGPEASLEHWADILSKLLEDSKQLILPSIEKLNLQAIQVLEDVLVNLRGQQIYQFLSNEVRSQKSVVNLANLQHKRIVEMKLLLHRLLHEQVKGQLMRVKQERLLEKVHRLNLGIQEIQMLKLNSLSSISVASATDAQVDYNHSCMAGLEGVKEEEVAGDKLTALRKVLDASERKIISLTKSLQTSCKMKGEPSCGEAIFLVTNHLKKKACCRFTRLGLQLWEVDNLKNMNGQRNMVLNYLGFIIQRLTVNVGPVSHMVVSNELNDVNILKNLPNMDAYTAFEFVISANTTWKYVGSRSLTQETQITSSVLGNLLDVVEEIQVARVELQNLIKACFHCPYVGKLELHLHFVNLRSGTKVALTLDVSCLQWGTYPTEIIPSLSGGPAAMSQKSLPETLSAEITAAIHDLRPGYLRLLRLCRSVSHAVHAWSG
ncbi:uncharacterized protein LOC127792022 isoform X2 [Diospyros lotus]|uniref:uncharacterized protein LOC127792022 isoform X2 n=1 Tax=Diospyros lotus TaxID=55363 RepID=UPI002258FA8A|nr:uncharacterized protein LOC127792022 isoform X2 [Diospyros lotus]